MSPTQVITLDYPIDPKPRYGSGKPPHGRLAAILAEARGRVAEHYRRILEVRAELQEIPRDASASDPSAPFWVNGFLSGLDAASLYAFLAALRPRQYFEIGSGNSTRFVHRARVNHRLPTRILSIDPHPRVEVAGLCDESIRMPLEEVDPSLFDRLEPGDILFMDGSHRVFTNSDATVFFLEVLPRLRQGVIVHIHDVFLPNDYPPEWSDRYYSEQYLLATWLLAGGPTEVLLPAAWATDQPDLAAILEPLWSDPRMESLERHGCSFWMRKR